MNAELNLIEILESIFGTMRYGYEFIYYLLGGFVLFFVLHIFEHLFESLFSKFNK